MKNPLLEIQKALSINTAPTSWTGTVIARDSVQGIVSILGTGGKTSRINSNTIWPVGKSVLIINEVIVGALETPINEIPEYWV